jgi:hypothetical protein
VAPRQGDGAAPADASAGAAQQLQTLVQASDLVADVTLAKGISHVPAPLRIIVTDYVFQVREVVKGAAADGPLIVRSDGGVLADGVAMDSPDAYKLTAGGRYLIFARKVKEGYRMTYVLRIERDGAIVATPEGRMVVGLRQGLLLIRTEVSYAPLHYLPARRTAAPKRQGPPEKGSFPVPKAEEPPAHESAEPITVDQVKHALRNAIKAEKIDDIAPRSGRSESRPSEFRPEAVTYGGYVSESTNFYCQLPDNNNWDWFQQCEFCWNQLVGESPSGRNWLVGFFNDSAGNPIRNEAPSANNGRYNMGVMTSAQMTAGGYPTWEALSANGYTLVWFTTTNGQVKEADVLINAAIASDAAQYRKSLTHELGHSLLLLHEDRYFAIMYAGTWRQPPNYASYWYSRTDDHVGVRDVLTWVNGNIDPNRWKLLSFTDVATYSQYHDNPGTSGNLVMTTLSATTVNRGDRVTFRNIHVENRGDSPAANLTLKFYLSWNPIISNIDTEIASYSWSSFGGLTYASFPYDALVPTSLAPGTYYAGWILTSDTADLTDYNNTALLLQDYSAGFATQTVTVR